MITVAHVSDLHLDGGDRATRRACVVLDALRAMPGPFDALLVSGDIADHGLAAEYKQARDLLDLPYPVLALPGNHDVRSVFAAELLGVPPRPDGDAELNQVVRVGDVDFLLCDSTVPGADHGELSDATLQWLDAELAGGDPASAALVCFHHPPAVLHAPYVDRIRQFREDRLAAVLRRHDRVRAVLCGHAHTAAATTFAGLPLLVAPGVVSTVRTAAEGVPSVDTDLPPAFAVHVLTDDGRLTTHYRPVGRIAP